MTCPKCGADMEFINSDFWCFEDEDDITLSNQYYCSNCKKFFRFMRDTKGLIYIMAAKSRVKFLD